MWGYRVKNVIRLCSLGTAADVLATKPSIIDHSSQHLQWTDHIIFMTLHSFDTWDCTQR